MRPNFQNLPIRTKEGREIRVAFQSVLHYEISDIDYSQVEFRIMSLYVKDEDDQTTSDIRV